MKINKELDYLKIEMAQLQTGRMRSRNLEHYSRDFDTKEPLSEVIKRFVLTGRMVYVDLGCGNAVALRESLLIADSLDLKDNLFALGVDILPPDLDKLKEQVQKFPDDYDPRILDKRYAPKIVQDNIDNVVLPKPADLITISSVLVYTFDPLKAFANAAVQMNVGGILCANALGVIKGETEESPSLLTKVISTNEEIPGFRSLGDPRFFPDTVVLEKTEPINSIEDLYMRWFGNLPLTPQRIPTKKDPTIQVGFDFYYQFSK